MRIISKKKLRDFWNRPGCEAAQGALKAWYDNVKSADWKHPADVRGTYGSADFVSRKVVFNVGGNKYRLIAVIDYEGHKVFVRFVLTHKEYDEGRWKEDTFGDDWIGRQAWPAKRRRRRRR